MFAGGLAVVMSPPASLRMQIPAATSLSEEWVSGMLCIFQKCGDAVGKSWEIVIRNDRGGRRTHHSQQPPSHQMSNVPVATYARSIVALNC
jgi:hypothetical protein